MAVDGIYGAFQAQVAQNAQANAAAETGKFMGHTVEVATSPASILADAAEELGFAVDRTKEYDIDQRKERDKAAMNKQELARLYQDLMHKAGKTQQMNTLIESLRQAGAMLTRQMLLRKARNAFSDPSDCWAGLMAAADELREEGADPALLKLIDESIEELEQQEGPAIRSGVQGAIASRGYESIGSTDSMRDLYRGVLGEFSSVNEVFSEIHEKYGDNFEQAMDFLFAAISADIDSENPSMGREHLESVHAKLGLVRLTQSGYRLCETQMQRWAEESENTVSSFNAMALLGELVALRGQRFLGVNNITTIVAKATPPDIEREVLFTQDLLNTVRNFPVALFDDEEGRMTVLNAVQQAVDQAVEREDEYLASLEE